MNSKNATRIEHDNDLENDPHGVLKTAWSIGHLTLHDDPNMRLIVVQLDLLKYLIAKALTETDGLPLSEDLQAKSDCYTAASRKIAEIENDDYMCYPADQELLQWCMNYLTSLFSEDPETIEWINRLVPLEEAAGLGEMG